MEDEDGVLERFAAEMDAGGARIDEGFSNLDAASDGVGSDDDEEEV